MSAPGSSTADAALLADIVDAQTRVKKAKAGLRDAEARGTGGTGSEVNNCRQIMSEALANLSILKERKKFMAKSRAAGEEASKLDAIGCDCNRPCFRGQ